MNAQFKKGIVEICILKVISDEEMYGFEIIERLSKRLDINENTIYPILRRLTEQGLFTTYTKDSQLGAPRKYYRITVEGIEALQTYQKEWTEFLNSVMAILKGDQNG